MLLSSVEGRSVGVATATDFRHREKGSHRDCLGLSSRTFAVPENYGHNERTIPLRTCDPSHFHAMVMETG
jgi:hypothetical protein